VNRQTDGRVVNPYMGRIVQTERDTDRGWQRWAATLKNGIRRDASCNYAGRRNVFVFKQTN
jgi:hypothetical protein